MGRPAIAPRRWLPAMALPSDRWMRPRRSIEWTLAWRLGILFLVVFAAAGAMVEARFRAGDVEVPNRLVQQHLHEVVKALHLDDSGAIDFRLGKRSRKFSYVVREPEGRVLFASVLPVPPHLAAIPADWDASFFRTEQPDLKATLFGAHQRVRVGSHEVVVQVAETDSDWKLEKRSFVDELLGDMMPIMLPFALATLLIGIVTIRRGLWPLKAVAAQATRITPRSTELRLSREKLPSELQPLVVAINGALDRLDRGFRMQREFTADAAHELRTPLAVLAAHLDSLEDRGVAANLREDVERMTRLVGQLLLVAQLEELSVAPDETADLHAIAVEVAASLTPLAVKRARSIAVTGEGPVRAAGNADALRQAVRNLVENALQHTRPNTTVEVAVSEVPAVAVIDHGPGVPAADRERLFQRFWRGRRDGSGAGLGLAIVARIVSAHGGSLDIDDAPGGGACFTLRLRPAAAG
jgi:signal transduction histidine kinase